MVRLRTAGLSVSYRRDRREAAAWLVEFASSMGLRFSRQQEPRVVDRQMAAVVQEAYEQGHRLYRVVLGVLGVQVSLGLSTPLLRSTWEAIKGWKSLTPTRPRVPISCFRLEVVVLTCLAEGARRRGYQRRIWWSVALALWTGFVCLLRPGELLNLRRLDISFPEGEGFESQAIGAVIIVRKPKTRRIWRQQFVLCRDPRLVRWLQWWMADVSGKTLLFGVSRYVLQKKFSDVLCKLGIDDCGYTLGSLRAGGATDFFQRTRNLGELQYQGRWTAASTLQYYLMEAFSAFVTSSVESSVREKLESVHVLKHLLNFPPKICAQEVFRRG